MDRRTNQRKCNDKNLVHMYEENEADEDTKGDFTLGSEYDRILKALINRNAM